MVFFTFDRIGSEQPDIEDLFTEPTKSDIVECGESNEYWISVRRSTCSVELISKVDGLTKKKIVVDRYFEKIAPSYQFGPRLVAIIRSALAGITPRTGPPGM